MAAVGILARVSRKLSLRYLSFALVAVLLWTLYLHYAFYAATYSDGVIILAAESDVLESTWECNHPSDQRRPESPKQRGKYCRVRNLCLSRQHGAYVISRTPHDEFSVNLVSSDAPSDIVMPVKVFDRVQTSPIQFVNATVVAWASYSGYHFSHWLFNGALPLFSVMREMNVSMIDRNMLFRPFSRDGEKIPFDMTYMTLDGNELVTTANAVHRDALGHTWQRLLPDHDVCFTDAVIGTGNRCVLGYCESRIPAQHAEEFRLWTLDYFASASQSNFDRIDFANQFATLHDRAAASLQSCHLLSPSDESPQIRIVLLNRSKTRHVVNMPDLAVALRALNSKSTSGAYFDVVELNLDTHPMSMADVALLMSTTAILVSPHGSGMGNAIWMPPKSTVISLGCRQGGSDWWFQGPFVAIQRRLWSWQCTDDECTVPDEPALIDILRQSKVQRDALTNDEFEATMNFTASGGVVGAQMRARGVSEESVSAYHSAYTWYLRDAKRRVRVDEIVTAVRSIADELMNGIVDRETGARRGYNELSFGDMCRLGRCCGGGCGGAMADNYGPGNYTEWNPLP